MSPLNLKHRIMEMYLSEPGTSLRYIGVAERLGASYEETFEALKGLTKDKVLFMKFGCYQPNPSFLWKDAELIKEFKEKAEGF
jgi:hypothetical protein